MLLLRLSKSDSLSSPSQKISKSIGENPLPSDRLTLCTFPFGIGDAPMTNTHEGLLVGVLDAVTSSLVFEPLRSSGNKTQERNQDTGSNDGHDDASNQTKVGVGNEEVGK